jgi:DNA adenine methylase
MRYLGGKTRIAKQIAEQINRVRKPGQWVWEPFCGGLGAAKALVKNGPVWATDANPALISLYQALHNDWQPPTQLSKEDYHAAKALPDSDPLKAFAGFVCSFSGKWFGGLVGNRKDSRSASFRSNGIWYATSTIEGLLADLRLIRHIACVDFLSVEPRETQALLYCDPPYAGTTGYRFGFDSARFLLRVAEWSRFTDVFVSEYQFPLGVCVWETAAPKISNLAKPGAIERLYYVQRGSL